MTSVTRTRLDRCRTKDCPWPLDEEIHRPWCLAIPGVQHTREAQHQHVPKRSQGGKRIAAILCAYCHDKVDNGADWNNIVVHSKGQRRYHLWDVATGEVLIDRGIGASTAEGESTPVGELADSGVQSGHSPSAAGASVSGRNPPVEDAGGRERGKAALQSLPLPRPSSSVLPRLEETQ